MQSSVLTQTNLPKPPPFLAVARELGIVGEHDTLISVLQKASRVAPMNMPVLLLGKSGTGKELFARFIHRLSGRTNHEFVALNCAAISANLVESELFGHEKGAFTGADRLRPGAFENATHGTLFLDEIGDMPGEQQAKLLRALQEGTIRRVRGDEDIRVRARIIAATNIDVAEALRNKRFRLDLYYRFRCVIQLPPLCHRSSDVPALAESILAAFLSRNGRPPGAQSFSPAALQLLQHQPWEGNVRELERVVEMSSIETSGATIELKDVKLSDDLILSDASEVQIPEPREGFHMERYLATVRQKLVERALEKTGHNRAAAARLLGCSRQNLMPRQRNSD